MWIWPIYRMSWIIWCISWGWKVAPAVITKLNKSFNFPCVHHTCNTDCTGGRSLELATLACSSASYNPLKQTRKAHDTNYSQILQNRPPRECANLQHFLCQHWDVCLLNKIDCTFEDDKKPTVHSGQLSNFAGVRVTWLDGPGKPMTWPGGLTGLPQWKVCLKIGHPQSWWFLRMMPTNWHSIWQNFWHVFGQVVTFYLTYIPKFYSTWHINPDICSDILSGILPDILSRVRYNSVHIFWHSIGHSAWHSIWHIYILTFYLAFCLTFCLSGTWTSILADITLDIPSGILSDIICSDIYMALYVAFWLAYFLTFHLAFYLTCPASFLACYLMSILTSYIYIYIPTFYLGFCRHSIWPVF